MNIKENSRFWDSEAPAWADHQPIGGSGEFAENSIRSVISEQLQQVSRKGYILDIGSGSGNKGYFDESVWDRVICFDISNKMLRLNNIPKKIQSLGQELPIQTESIEFCTSIYLLRYLSKIDHINFLKEVIRVLRPKGGLIIIDISTNGYECQSSEFNAQKISCVAEVLGFVDVITEEKNILIPTGILRARKPEKNTDSNRNDNRIQEYINDTNIHAEPKKDPLSYLNDNKGHCGWW